MQVQVNTQVQIAHVIEKLQQLSFERISEVEDFIDFLKTKTEDRKLIQNAMINAENSFQKIWDNPEDADYDKL